MTCPECGTTPENTYECPDCDVAHCVECRRPQDHECTQTVTEEPTGLDQPFGAMKHGVALLIAFATVAPTSYASNAEFAGGIVGGLIAGYGLVYITSLVVNRVRGSPNTQ